MIIHRRLEHVAGLRLRRDRLPEARRLREMAVVALLLSLGPAGCAESRRGPWEGASSLEPLVLEVRNNNYLEVVVYALPDGARARLGTVTGKRDAVLHIPPSVAFAPNGFRLQADPVGSAETFVSEFIYAHAGTVVVLEVGSVLSMSSWHLR
jgi:hypothetical protein